MRNNCQNQKNKKELVRFLELRNSQRETAVIIYIIQDKLTKWKSKVYKIKAKEVIFLHRNFNKSTNYININIAKQT